jgi:FAD/FMN-containing dehydrogenase
MPSPLTAAPAADRAALDGLADLPGGLLRPGDPGYDEARQVANAGIDRHPVAIARPVDAAGVARVVRFARAGGLPLAVKAGGHSAAGHGVGLADGALVIDLSGMKRIEVDPARRVATAEAGVLAGEYVRATFAHGLTTPLGDTPTVGLGGLVLGGGMGYLARKHGLAIDHLRAVEIVLADGSVVRASADEHPDLFWAVRGGGGSFGIVTRFELGLVPIGTILGGMLMLPATRDVLRSYVPIAASAPADLGTIAAIMAAPPLPFVPAEQHGTLVLLSMVAFDGEPAAGQAALEPFRAVAAPVAEMLGEMPYPAIFEMGGPEGRMGFVARSFFLPALDDAAVATILDHMGRRTSPMAMVQLRVLGGAVSRVASDATAYAFRDRPLAVVVIVPFMDPAEAATHASWADGLLAALRPAASGVYSNFLDDEGPARVREAYPGLTWLRLADVKRRYDPTNLFRSNQNIVPAG